ncbi:Protein of unknown function [Fictibacillus solisalsi]|uniref:DUF998 domain-containing protein n=1 Tax=Fictibacillus solisalsi TaxID=459525 RepID=A0A1G9UNU4_9BACL|nr:DUF998 domain-containing protein [Fictibacillus solisalsi]SDM61215.1 Protein of unknown function [Fictibacillus solisalsi]
MQTAYAKKSNVSLIRLLLIGGVVSTPLFYAIAIIQAFTRKGFDIRRHAISTLTLGDLGWIQSANFIITGLLAVLASIGFRKLLRGGKGGTWGALLIGIYGIGMIVAGLFPPDPGLGFPTGAPPNMPATMSGHAALHSMAFFIAFICLIVATIIFSRRFAAQGERGLRTYCIATGIISPLLIILGIGINSWTGLIMGCAGIVAFGWVSVLAARLLAYAPTHLLSEKDFTPSRRK